MENQKTEHTPLRFYTLEEIREDIKVFEDLKREVDILGTPEAMLDSIRFAQLYSQHYSTPLSDDSCVNDLRSRIDKYLSETSIPWVDELPLEGFSATIYFEKERYKFYKYAQYTSREDNKVLSKVFNDPNLNSIRIGFFSHNLKCFTWFKRMLQ